MNFLELEICLEKIGMYIVGRLVKGVYLKRQPTYFSFFVVVLNWP